MSETTNETVVDEQSDGTKQSQANDGTEVEFTIPSLLNNLANALHQLLAPHGQQFYVLVVGPPNEEGNVDMNTISSIPAGALPPLLMEQANHIAQNERAKAVTPEDLEAALAELGADPATAAEVASDDNAEGDKPATS
jgi:hypothetical protein